MWRIVYISTAVSGIDQASVETLLATSRARNADQGITGLLLFNGHNFLQILEGERNAIGPLMQSILADPRHSGVSVVRDEAIAARSFGGWDMRYVAIDLANPDRLAVLADAIPSTLEPDIAAQLENFATLLHN